MNVTFSKRMAACAMTAMLLLAGAARADTTVVILRHGEKPPMGLGQITCQGLNRALALAPLLLARYGTPAAIYAPNPSVLKNDRGTLYAYVRPLATIEPLAVRAGLPVNVEWGMLDIKPLAARLLAATDGTHVVAWEHHLGKELARLLMAELGGRPEVVPEWASEDYDSLYVIRIRRDADGTRRASFSHEAQGLDGQPQACPS